MLSLIDPVPLAFVSVGVSAFDLMELHVPVAITKTACGLY